MTLLKRIFIVLASLPLLLVGCADGDGSGERTLVGEWEVSEIATIALSGGQEAGSAGLTATISRVSGSDSGVTESVSVVLNRLQVAQWAQDSFELEVLWSTSEIQGPGSIEGTIESPDSFRLQYYVGSGDSLYEVMQEYTRAKD